MRATQLFVACIVLALAGSALASDAAPRKRALKAVRVLKPKSRDALLKPVIVPKGQVAAMRSMDVSAQQPMHPALPPIGGFAMVAVESSASAAEAVAAGKAAALSRAHGGAAAHRFAVMRRDRMQLVLRGWISDFFSWFENKVAVLTERVKQTVLQTVNAFEDRAVTVYKDVSALWTYFKAGNNGITQEISDLWINTRCDICQSALLHIYAKGCAYASQGICNVVDFVACGTFKPVCDKYLCPLIQKHWLQPECANIVNRLDSALLDKATKKYSVLDNFATLAVCKRVGLCRDMDKPFDGNLLTAIADQARRLTAESAKTPKNPAAAVAAANSGVPVPIPSQRFSKPGMYALPGLRATLSIWLNNQYNSPRYGKPYYMFWDMESGGPAKLAGIKELWWLKSVGDKSIEELGPDGVLQALNGQPGTNTILVFEDSGFFGSSFPKKFVTFAQWPVQYASLAK